MTVPFKYMAASALLKLQYALNRNICQIHCILGDSRNYFRPILVPSSAKRIATQILAIAKLNGRKNFILRGFICDIIRPSKGITCSKLVT